MALNRYSPGERGQHQSRLFPDLYSQVMNKYDHDYVRSKGHWKVNMGSDFKYLHPHNLDK